MECYLLTICRSSSLDRDSNNFSLMHLVESIQVPEDVLGKPIPLEMHAYYISTDDELNQDYEFRIVWRCDDGRETPGEINTRTLWRADAAALKRLALFVGAPTCCRSCAVRGALRAPDHHGERRTCPPPSTPRSTSQSTAPS